VRAWAPAVLWAALIFALSSFPTLPQAPAGFTDKHEHFGAYAVLAAFVLRGVSGASWSGVTAGTAAGAAAIATAYGMTDEFHQRFVPPREPSWLDVAADAFGASAASGLLWAWAIIRRRS